MPAEIFLLKLISFIDLLGIGLVVPLLTKHVIQMGGSHIAIGALSSIYAGFQLGSGPLIGSWSDLKGRKNVLIFTLLICSVTYVVIGTTNSILYILIARAVLGVFKQTQMLTRAMISEYEKSKDKHAAIYGKMAAASGIGITLGPMIGGHIAEDFPKYKISIVSILASICFLINAGIAYLLLPDEKTKKPKKNSKQKNISKGILHVIYQNLEQSVIQLKNIQWSDYWDILLLKACSDFAIGVYLTNYYLYLSTIFNLTPKYIGYVVSFQGTITTISSYFMWYIQSFYPHDKEYCLQNVHTFILLFVSMLGLAWAYNIYIYVLWLIPLAIGNAMCRIIPLEMILNRSHGKHSGTLIGSSNSVRSLTGIVAPMVSGYVAHLCGISYVLYASIFSTLLGLIISFYCYRIAKLKIKHD